MKRLLIMMAAMAGVFGCSPKVDDGADVFKTGGRTVRMYCIKHGSVRMQIGDKWYYIDPVTEAAQPSTDYTLLPKADYIFITHEHGDHLDAKAVAQLSKDETMVFGNQASVDKLSMGQALSTEEILNLPDGVSVCAVPAYNTSEGKLNFHPAGRDFGYVFNVDGFRIYVAGDTEVIPEMADLKGTIDVAFLPCNLPYTMTPEQAAEAAKIIMPKVLFPYHYGQTDIQQLANLLDGTGIDVRIRQYQ